MARHSSGVQIPGLELRAVGKKPLSAQLFSALREAVLSGRLERGARMPSSRSLAADLGVSRTTVIQAYEQLQSEGYLEGREKSGTFVSNVLPERDNTVLSGARAFATRAPAAARLADRLDGVSIPEPKGSHEALAFNPGIPAVRDFPYQQFSRIHKQVMLGLAPSRMSRCPAEGAPALREQVAAYLQSSRGVVCDPGQVFIISGTRQALLLVLMAISNPGDCAWAEDPGYPGAKRAYDLFRLRTVPVPVDASGLVVARGRALCDSARFAYVTPARQAPFGHTMTIRRRFELLNWAHARDALILEDDYDGEYRFGGYPSPSLQSLDPDGG